MTPAEVHGVTNQMVLLIGHRCENLKYNMNSQLHEAESTFIGGKTFVEVLIIKISLLDRSKR
jgi:hypothetical protein